MKTMTNSKVLMGTIIAFLLVSCNDDDPIPEMDGDVYYLSRVIEQDTVYALGFQVASNVEMVSVSAASTYYPAVNLEMSYSSYFYYDPNDAEYTPEVPYPDNFVFTAQLLGGEVLSASDQLQNDYLDPVEIVSAEFQGGGSLLAAWNETEGAEYYQIRLLDQSRNVVYLSQGLSGQTNSYTISTGSSEWTDGYTPENEELLTFEIMAFLYDSTNSSGKLQSAAITSLSLNWQN